MQIPTDYGGGDLLYSGFERLTNSTVQIEADTATGTLNQTLKPCHI